MNFFRRLVYYLVGLVIVGIFLFLVLNCFVMPWVVKKGDVVVVPDVEGMHVDSAFLLLKRSSLVPVVDTIIPSAEVPSQHVMEQDPAPGYQVKRGRRVFLKVSGGIALVKIPDLIGMKREKAEALLKDMGLEVSVEFVESEEYESDVVLDISPPPGERVPKGSRVILFVSKEVL